MSYSVTQYVRWSIRRGTKQALENRLKEFPYEFQYATDEDKLLMTTGTNSGTANEPSYSLRGGFDLSQAVVKDGQIITKDGEVVWK